MHWSQICPSATTGPSSSSGELATEACYSSRCNQISVWTRQLLEQVHEGSPNAGRKSEIASLLYMAMLQTLARPFQILLTGALSIITYQAWSVVYSIGQGHCSEDRLNLE